MGKKKKKQNSKQYLENDPHLYKKYIKNTPTHTLEHNKEVEDYTKFLRKVILGLRKGDRGAFTVYIIHKSLI